MSKPRVKTGIAEAMPVLSCPTMLSYREAPSVVSFLLPLQPQDRSVADREGEK